MSGRAIGAVDAAFRVLLALLMATMVACVTWQIVSRYLLDDPSAWTEELARFLLIWVGLLGGSYAYHTGMHLGLGLLSDRLSARARRAQAVFIHGIVIVFALAVPIAGGLRLIWLTAEIGQYSPALRIPMAVVYFSLPISGLMLVLYGASAIAAQFAPPDGARNP